MTLQRSGVMIAVVSAAALAVPLVGATTANANSGGRSVVANATPAWATNSAARKAIPTGKRLSVRVGVQMRDRAGAEALVKAVSDPHGKRYGHYFSARKFTATYGPSAASVKRITAFLKSHGLRVTGVAQGNMWVDASGTVAQLNRAFGTTLRSYSVDGRTLHAPSAPVTVPASIRPDVLTVGGLASRISHPRPATVNPAPPQAVPDAERPPASECSTYWGQFQQTLPKFKGKTRFNTSFCGYGPAQMRKIYKMSGPVAHGKDGQGVTVAIIDAFASPTMEADANHYSELMGEPTFKPGQYTETLFTPFDTSECGNPDAWHGEESLDVEAVHAMAPGANIHYVGAHDCDQGLDDAMNYIIQNHVADIVSNSYANRGEQIDPSEMAESHAMYMQAAAEGIGLYFSSGDSGDLIARGLPAQPDYPASDPDVTAVGGTSEFVNRHGRRINSTGWETQLNTVDYSGTKAVYEGPHFWAGAGGGTSTKFEQPWYQKGTVPAPIATRDGQVMREVPDVSADADPYTGFYVGRDHSGDFQLHSSGGTSLACPLFAGMQAVAEQDRSFPIGFANPLLYSISSSAYHDIVPQAPIHFTNAAGSYLGTFEAGDTQTSRYGYDNITGRGTPRGNAFLRAEATSY